MTSFFRDPLVWITLAVLIITIVVMMRARITNMALRRKASGLENDRDAAYAELNRLQVEFHKLEARHADALAEARRDAGERIKAVLKSAMGTLQSLAEEQLIALDSLQKKYGDNEGILADLMLVDQLGSQISRRAKVIAVICGGWLGRRDSSWSVYDVARSAKGRIKHFPRVSIHSQVNVSALSKVVEPVAVALAELLDNATNYSAPDKPVEVSIQAVPSGVCLIVDDRGVGMMRAEAKERATALLSPQSPIEITDLGEPPKFGFAACGILASRYGFSVSVDSTSPYGGVRAVIRLPKSLLAEDSPEPKVGSADGGRVNPPGVAPQRLAAVATGDGAQANGTTLHGLPKRRRTAQVVSVPRPDATEPTRTQDVNEVSASDGEVTAARIGAFARGTLLGRDTTTTEGHQDQ
jgi:hypothetical protein